MFVFLLFFFSGLPGFDKEPQDTMVYPGQIAYLGCVIKSTSTPLTIQWLKDERPLYVDESRMSILPSGALEIDDVQQQDIGSYRCNASGFGQHKLSNKAQLGLLNSDTGIQAKERKTNSEEMKLKKKRTKKTIFLFFFFYRSNRNGAKFYCKTFASSCYRRDERYFGMCS